MNSTDKNQTISLRILALVLAGKTLAEAMDAVLGAGAYEKLTGELYEALRK